MVQMRQEQEGISQLQIKKGWGEREQCAKYGGGDKTNKTKTECVQLQKNVPTGNAEK